MNETTPSPLNNVITIDDEWIEMYLAGVSVRRVEDITEVGHAGISPASQRARRGRC
jgi:hypothetical protein